jgi:hypothetical protein
MEAKSCIPPPKTSILHVPAFSDQRHQFFLIIQALFRTREMAEIPAVFEKSDFKSGANDGEKDRQAIIGILVDAVGYLVGFQEIGEFQKTRQPDFHDGFPHLWPLVLDFKHFNA